MNRYNVVCLGVRDMERSRRFYSDLGFECLPNPDFAEFFSAGGMRLALFDMDFLLHDINSENPPAVPSGEYAGFNFEYMAKSVEEVDDIIKLAKSVGAEVVKEPEYSPGGVYHAYFRDPDGYYWEATYMEHVEFDENGMVKR